MKTNENVLATENAAVSNPKRLNKKINRSGKTMLMGSQLGLNTAFYLKRNLGRTFLCLLLISAFSSCSNFSKDKLNRLIGRSPAASYTQDMSEIKTEAKEKLNKLIRRSPAAAYTLDVSEGKTEIEKTLIVKWNNVAETLALGIEKKKNGEELTQQERIELLYTCTDFLEFLQKNETNASHELIDKIKETLNTMLQEIQR